MKMAISASLVTAIFLIGALIVISIILITLGVGNRNALQFCENNENLNCFSLTCNTSAGDDGRPVAAVTATCQQYAYRCVDQNHVMCSFASGVVKEIDPADQGIIVCSGNNIPCK